MREFARTSSLEASESQLLERARMTRSYRRGEVIFHQDETSTGIYCVQSGHILIWHKDIFGHKTAFRVASSSELLGYRSFFGEDVHTATAQALTVCHICYYPRPPLKNLIDRCPNFAWQFLRTLARDRGPPDALLLRGRYTPVRIRLILLLLILKDRYAKSTRDGGLIFQLPLSRGDIASMLGTRPESVARIIKELNQQGTIVFHGRKVTVTNLAILYEEANLENGLD